jgi:hypothetical protein
MHNNTPLPGLLMRSFNEELGEDGQPLPGHKSSGVDGVSQESGSGRDILVTTSKLLKKTHNLRTASRLIFLEPSWDIKDDENPRYQLKRVGQRNPPFEYPLECRDSRTERNVIRHRKKELYWNQ